MSAEFLAAMIWEAAMSLSLDPRTTALVLIDLQKGILSRPLSPYGAPQIIERSVRLGQRIRDAGGLVVLVNVAFASGFADRLSQPVDAPQPSAPGGLPADWSDFAPEVASLPGDVIVTKRQWGAFHGTELDLQLRRRGITTIVLGGIATNFGVESTAREAWQHNYAVIIAEDACTSIGPGMHQFAIEKILPRVARIRSTAEILAALPAG
jgi:nicotinamidase-related amidase